MEIEIRIAFRSVQPSWSLVIFFSGGRSGLEIFSGGRIDNGHGATAGSCGHPPNAELLIEDAGGNCRGQYFKCLISVDKIK